MNSSRSLCSRICLENTFAITPKKEKKNYIFHFFFGGGGGDLKAKQSVIKCIHFLLHCCSSFDVVHTARKRVEREFIYCESHLEIYLSLFSEISILQRLGN